MALTGLIPRLLCRASTAVPCMCILCLSNSMSQCKLVKSVKLLLECASLALQAEPHVVCAAPLMPDVCTMPSLHCLMSQHRPVTHPALAAALQQDVVPCRMRMYARINKCYLLYSSALARFSSLVSTYCHSSTDTSLACCFGANNTFFVSHLMCMRCCRW